MIWTALLDGGGNQAACLDPILKAKIWSWAAASGGLLPSAGKSGEYLRAEVGGDPGGIKWAQLKSVERAVEKVVRVYQKVLVIPISVAWLSFVDVGGGGGGLWSVKTV
jgi:hypothetical protein